MGISLNDHENRLQSIERRDWWTLTEKFDSLIPQGGYAEVCRYNPNEVKMIFIYFTHDRQNSTDMSNDILYMTILPAGKESYECKILPVVIHDSANEEIWIKVNVGVISMKTTGSNTTDNRCLCIYGFGDQNKLKLYYNFSYNIYRLANSISFHFFKCLINSFKGGVKEIWQLV